MVSPFVCLFVLNIISSRVFLADFWFEGSEGCYTKDDESYDNAPQPPHQNSRQGRWVDSVVRVVRPGLTEQVS
uniref:Putative secreted protein n=1 Tax=Anopheles darlingi TaxID=43151 RepID=A0A2M4DF30_ANODA